MPDSTTITIGSLVRTNRHAGVFRVVDFVVSPLSHSPVPILDAILRPVGESWHKGTRRVPRAELLPFLDDDTKDFPCSPV